MDHYYWLDSLLLSHFTFFYPKLWLTFKFESAAKFYKRNINFWTFSTKLYWRQFIQNLRRENTSTIASSGLIETQNLSQSQYKSTRIWQMNVNLRIKKRLQVYCSLTTWSVIARTCFFFFYLFTLLQRVIKRMFEIISHQSMYIFVQTWLV